MKRIEFNELIEKAFSIGYEMGQKEFGNKENKRKRKEWEWKEADKIGQKLMRDGIEMTKGDAIRAQRLKNVADTHGGVGRYIDEKNIPHDIYSDEVLNLITGKKEDRSVHHKINTRSIAKNRSGKITKKSLLKGIEQDIAISDLGDVDNVHINANRYETMRTGGKRRGDFIKNNKKEENSNIKKDILDKKNLKKAGLALAGTAAAAGIAYGAKKLYDKRKKAREEAKKNKEQNKKAED